MRKLISFTFLIPALLWISWLGLRSFYTAGLIVPQHPASFRATKGILRAVDGASIPYTLIQISGRSPQSSSPVRQRFIVLFVSDLNRDRNWDTKGLSPEMGRRVAEFLAKNGLGSVRFDMRGSGSSDASRATWNDPRLHLHDLRTMLDFLHKSGYQRKNIIFLSHGDYGAYLTLRYLSQRPDAAACVFVNTSLQETYLESWGEQIFLRMRERNVLPAIQRQAHREWEEFLRTGSILQTADSDPADLVAFRNTLRYLLRPENRAFYEDARDFSIRTALARILVPVFLWKGEYVRTFTKSKNPEKLISESHILILEKTDYMLREYERYDEHFLAYLAREFAPRITLSRDFQRTFLKNFHYTFNYKSFSE